MFLSGEGSKMIQQVRNDATTTSLIRQIHEIPQIQVQTKANSSEIIEYWFL